MPLLRQFVVEGVHYVEPNLAITIAHQCQRLNVFEFDTGTTFDLSSSQFIATMHAIRKWPLPLSSTTISNGTSSLEKRASISLSYKCRALLSAAPALETHDAPNIDSFKADIIDTLIPLVHHLLALFEYIDIEVPRLPLSIATSLGERLREYLIDDHSHDLPRLIFTHNTTPLIIDDDVEGETKTAEEDQKDSNNIMNEAHDWSCSVCNAMNKGEYDTCGACGTHGLVDDATGGGGTASVSTTETLPSLVDLLASSTLNE
jgi:hypothetical protein